MIAGSGVAALSSVRCWQRPALARTHALDGRTAHKREGPRPAGSESNKADQLFSANPPLLAVQQTCAALSPVYLEVPRTIVVRDSSLHLFMSTFDIPQAYLLKRGQLKLFCFVLLNLRQKTMSTPFLVFCLVELENI